MVGLWCAEGLHLGYGADLFTEQVIHDDLVLNDARV